MLSTVTACDSVFGIDKVPDADAAADSPPRPDLDRDNVPDDVDPCIAAAQDASSDIDGDLLLNGMDPCPFDGVVTVDPDVDGLEAACDPFPNHVDARRCVMTFSDSTLNGLLWRPRTGEGAWSALPTVLTSHGPGVNTTIAAESLEPATGTTTFDVRITWDEVNGSQGGMVVWLRASPDGQSTNDTGCAYVRGATFQGVVVLAQGGQLLDPQIVSTSGGMSRVRLRASINHTDPATVSCSISVEGSPWSVPATIAIPAVSGRFGFTVKNWQADVYGIDIIQD